MITSVILELLANTVGNPERNVKYTFLAGVCSPCPAAGLTPDK